MLTQRHFLGAAGGRATPLRRLRPQPLTDRSASVCLFSCRRPRGDARSAAWEYALPPGAAAAPPGPALGQSRGQSGRFRGPQYPLPLSSDFFDLAIIKHFPGQDAFYQRTKAIWIVSFSLPLLSLLLIPFALGRQRGRGGKAPS